MSRARFHSFVAFVGVWLSVACAFAAQGPDADAYGTSRPDRSGPFSFRALLFDGLDAEIEPLVSYPSSIFSLDSSALNFAVERKEEQPALIYRGTNNLSDLPIKPFDGRFFGYLNASWGMQESQATDVDRSGFNVASWGGGIGQDWVVSNANLVWGYGIQANKTELDPRRNSYEARIDSLVGVVHTSIYDALWRFDVSLGAAKNWQKQTSADKARQISFSASQWTFESEFGARVDRGYTRVEPRINLRMLNLSEPRRAESLRASSARSQEFSDASYRLKIGSRFSWDYAARSAALRPYLNVDWACELGNRAIYTIGDDSPFAIAYRYAGCRMPRNRLDLGGGLNAALRDTCDVYFQYDVQFAKEYSDHFLYAGFNKKF